MRVEVKSKDKKGNEVVVYVQQPTLMDEKEAQFAANSAVAKAIKSDALLRKELFEFMRKKNMWSDDHQARLEALDKDIETNLMKLKAGGCKLSAAREIAVLVRELRLKRTLLLLERNQLDEYTVESQGDDARFDYLVSVCVKDEQGKNVFEDVAHYLRCGDEPYARVAAAKLAVMVHGIDDNWEANLPENRFLTKHKFVDDSLRLINKDGKFVDREGRLLDDNLNYVDSEGHKVDDEGHILDADGLPEVEFSPFLDDDNQPILD